MFFSCLFLYHGDTVEGASTDYGAEQFKKALRCVCMRVRE